MRNKGVHPVANDFRLRSLAPLSSAAERLNLGADAVGVAQRGQQEQHGEMPSLFRIHVFGQGPVENDQFSGSLVIQQVAGMGIGVYESAQYVKALGGEIRVESGPATGTKVQVLLPQGETALSSTNTDGAHEPRDAKKAAA